MRASPAAVLSACLLAAGCVPLPDRGAEGEPCFGNETCEADLVCDQGTCVAGCAPTCGDAVCGPDGCGGTCGECPAGQACTPEGQCEICDPDCAGRCGGVDDGCGGTCAQECPAGWWCDQGACATCSDDSHCGAGCLACTDLPTDRACVAGTCGCRDAQDCADGQGCVASVCGDCAPACAGRNCGPDGCGGVCGECAAGEECTLETGQCTAAAAPALAYDDIGGVVLPAGTHRATFEVRFSEPVTGLLGGGLVIDQAAFIVGLASTDRQAWTFEVFGLRHGTTFRVDLTDEITDLSGTPLAPIFREFQVAAGPVIYVRQDAFGDGSSPDTPTGDLINVMVTAEAGTEVWIAQGSFFTFAELVTGVSFFCGFSSNFATRDPRQYPTQIENDGLYATMTFMGAEGGVTRVMDGCEIRNLWGGQAQGQPTVGIDINSASPIVTRNRVHTAASFDQIGIRTRAGSPVLIDNQVTSDPISTDQQYTGILVEGPGDAWIGHNDLLGGDGPGDSTGIDCSNAGGRIEANKIGGGVGLGMAPDSRARGLRLVSAEPVVVNNLIHGGAHKADTAGIELHLTRALLSHNTVFAGLGTTRATAILLGEDDAHPSLINNLLFAGPDTGTCLAEEVGVSAGSDPAALWNNAFVGCPDGIYLDEGLTPLASGALIDALDGTEIEDTACTPGVDCEHARAGQNRTPLTTLDAVFVDPDGADGDPASFADADWHLLTDDPGITAGGRNTFTDSCGSVETPRSCGHVSRNFDGSLRLPPVSIGAH